MRLMIKLLVLQSMMMMCACSVTVGSPELVSKQGEYTLDGCSDIVFTRNRLPLEPPDVSWIHPGMTAKNVSQRLGPAEYDSCDGPKICPTWRVSDGTHLRVMFDDACELVTDSERVEVDC